MIPIGRPGIGLRMTASLSSRFRRIASCVALVAVTGLVMLPVTAAAHHHESDTAFAENDSAPAGAAVESDCPLCVALSLHDGKILEGNNTSALDVSAAVCAIGNSRDLLPPAKFSRALSIRGPPANA